MGLDCDGHSLDAKTRIFHEPRKLYPELFNHTYSDIYEMLLSSVMRPQSHLLPYQTGGPLTHPIFSAIRKRCKARMEPSSPRRPYQMTAFFQPMW